jgi:hypothetical protein
LAFETLAVPAVIVASLAALLLLVSTDWRLSIIALALQYAGIFALVAISWPLEMAVVKLVAGWMAGAVLGMALVGVPEEGRHQSGLGPATRLFRILVAVIVGLGAVSLAQRMVIWVPEIGLEQVYGGALLIGLGLLHLGLTAQPFRVALGLLTVLGGFEILYAAVETSTLVTGLLAGVDLGLALVGAYLLTVPTIKDAE